MKLGSRPTFLNTQRKLLGLGFKLAALLNSFACLIPFIRCLFQSLFYLSYPLVRRDTLSYPLRLNNRFTSLRTPFAKGKRPKIPLQLDSTSRQRVLYMNNSSRRSCDIPNSMDSMKGRAGRAIVSWQLEPNVQRTSHREGAASCTSAGIQKERCR